MASLVGVPRRTAPKISGFQSRLHPGLRPSPARHLSRAHQGSRAGCWSCHGPASSPQVARFRSSPEPWTFMDDHLAPTELVGDSAFTFARVRWHMPHGAWHCRGLPVERVSLGSASMAGAVFHARLRQQKEENSDPVLHRLYARIPAQHWIPVKHPMGGSGRRGT